MSRLNSMEQECQDVLIAIMDLWTATPHAVNRHTYMEMLGRVRDLVRKLENKEYGCETGTHAGRCTCKGGIRGHSLPAG